MTRGARAARIAPLLVAVVTFVAFLPVLHAGFVDWDDARNFLNNPHYRGLGPIQLRWMWSTFLLGHYVPLSWMTLGLDYTVWGMNATGYHLSNLLLHSANAVLVYFIARRVLRAAGVSGDEDGRGVMIPATLAALLFAVHPLRVESVAWVTERRDVLSGFFYLLTVLWYLRAVEREPVDRRRYWIAVALFICALLSKGIAVTGPALLLVLNIYPLRRFGLNGEWKDSGRRIARELLPFAVPAAIVAIITIVAVHPSFLNAVRLGSLAPDDLTALAANLSARNQFPLAAKVAVSAYSLGFYLWKTVAPIGLSPLYEMPQRVDPASGIFVANYLIVAALALLAWMVRRRWPGVTAALVAFVVITLPMLGIVQNGPQIAADRYTYHAAPALAILAAASFWIVFRTTPIRGVIGVAAPVIVVLSWLTWHQSTVWRSSQTLWARVLAVDSTSALGQSAMANILFSKNDVPGAMAHSLRAVQLAPDYPEAHNDLGIGFAREGRPAEAIEEYRQAIALKPQFDEAESNLGVVLAQQGKFDEAIAHYQRALSINPDIADAQVNWGNVLVREGKADDAIAHYKQALWIRPDHADAQHNWGVALARQGKLAEAIEHFKLALAIDPNHAEAKEYLARATELLRQQQGH